MLVNVISRIPQKIQVAEMDRVVQIIVNLNDYCKLCDIYFHPWRNGTPDDLVDAFSETYDDDYWTQDNAYSLFKRTEKYLMLRNELRNTPYRYWLTDGVNNLKGNRIVYTQKIEHDEREDRCWHFTVYIYKDYLAELSTLLFKKKVLGIDLNTGKLADDSSNKLLLVA